MFMSRVLHWNGKDVPPELRELRPRSYIVAEYAEDMAELPPGEEDAIRQGLAEIDRGESVPAEQVHAELRELLKRS